MIKMAKLTEKEREAFERIIEEDMKAIQVKLISQIKDFWAKAREEVLKTKGWDKLIIEKQELNDQINKCRARINEIESQMNKSELTPEQVVELEGNPNEYGQYRGANFHGIPVTSQFEYDIVEYIRKHIDLKVPAKFIYDLGRATQRALTMSGTFEEAREQYEEFYKLDFRKYGVDIPPRLAEVKKDLESLNYTQSAIALPVEKQGEAKAIENKKADKIDYFG